MDMEYSEPRRHRRASSQAAAVYHHRGGSNERTYRRASSAVHGLPDVVDPPAHGTRRRHTSMHDPYATRYQRQVPKTHQVHWAPTVQALTYQVSNKQTPPYLRA
jgi:hypothetical protein